MAMTTDSTRIWIKMSIVAAPTDWITLGEATEMLSWRSRHLDRTMTGMLLQDGGIGRRPAPAVVLQ